MDNMKNCCNNQKHFKSGDQNLNGYEEERYECLNCGCQGWVEKEELMKIPELKKLIAEHGEAATLGGILKRVQDSRPYECPKCIGTGQETYNTYPQGLPDSGFVYEAGYRDCNLCKGHGFTTLEYKEKTKTEVIGYERT